MISTNPSHKIYPDYGFILEETMLGDAPTFEPTPENREISVNYVCLCEIWNQNEIIIDDVFVFVVAAKIKIAMKSNLTPLMNKYQRRDDWPKRKETILVKLDSLTKRKVFWTCCSYTFPC